MTNFLSLFKKKDCTWQSFYAKGSSTLNKFCSSNGDNGTNGRRTDPTGIPWCCSADLTGEGDGAIKRARIIGSN